MRRNLSRLPILSIILALVAVSFSPPALARQLDRDAPPLVVRAVVVDRVDQVPLTAVTLEDLDLPALHEFVAPNARPTIVALREISRTWSTDVARSFTPPAPSSVAVATPKSAAERYGYGTLARVLYRLSQGAVVATAAWDISTTHRAVTEYSCVEANPVLAREDGTTRYVLKGGIVAGTTAGSHYGLYERGRPWHAMAANVGVSVIQAAAAANNRRLVETGACGPPRARGAAVRVRF